MHRLTMFLALALFGCGPTDYSTSDECLRREIFQQCLASVPKGPQTTQENPWHKVIAECESAAYYQSQRLSSRIKPECRPGV